METVWTVIVDTVLPVIGWVLFGLAILVGLILDLLGLFGNWVILGAVVVAWIVMGFEHFSIATIVILTILAIVGEIVEAAAAGFGAKKFGGTKGSMVAAVVGCILGAILGSPVFPILGTLAGACVGAFAGATLYEFLQAEKKAQHAAWAGLGAALGKVAGMLAKVVVGLIMLGVAAWTY
jgi:uncharacterized protein YqgC (DUF456 family)